jgi:hypothetical protein
MTEGYLSCPLCAGADQPQVIGYQPVYRELDGRPVMVIVYELQRENVDALKLHQMVTVGRGPEVTDTVYLAPLLTGGQRYYSTLPERMKPIDVTETLLRMWQIPILTDWYRRTHDPNGPSVPASDTPLSQEPEQEVKPISAGLGRWVGVALGHRAGEVDRVRANDEFVRRTREEEEKRGKSKK